MWKKEGGIFSIIVLLAYFSYKYFEVRDGKLIQTKSGWVQGVISTSRDGRGFYQWSRIPYAQPPVGSLRFATPKRIGEWKGILDGRRLGPRCAQLDMLTGVFNGEEDCLHLNVHVPKLESEGQNLTSLRLPVMVFIHGGAFYSWSGVDFGADYFMDEHVVLITINYRLGPLGFLTTGDKFIRGNMGLKDQVMGLEWIKENIEFFGGDPQRVTIFGESAGGVSTHHLMLLSQKVTGLFQKVISMSGSALSSWSTISTEKSFERTKLLANSLGCPLKSEELTECLRKFDVSELLAQFKFDLKDLFAFKPYGKGEMLPVVIEKINDEEALVTQSPFEILVQGKGQRIPWMTGLTSEEGLISSLAFYREEGSLEIMEKDFDDHIHFLMKLWDIPVNLAAEVKPKIREFYFPAEKKLTDNEKISRYTQLFTDSFFMEGLTEAVTMQRPFSPVYPYYFTKNAGDLSFGPVLAGINTNFALTTELVIVTIKNWIRENILRFPPKHFGACHTDELPYLFPMMGLLSIRKNLNNPHYIFSKDLVKLWISFATDDTSMEFRRVKFPATGKEGKLRFLQIDEGPRIIIQPHEETVRFWQSLNITAKRKLNQLKKTKN